MATRQIPANQQQRVIVPRPRRQWEYTTLSADRPLDVKQFDVYGTEGWELVGIYVQRDSVYAVFKREVV